MAKHVVATSLNGQEVYAFLMHPPLSSRLSRNPHLIALIKEIVPGLELTKPRMIIEKDMGRSIGYGEVVTVEEGDVVFYARQIREDVFTKFVKNRRTDPTSVLTLQLQRDDEGNYEIQDVGIGGMFPPVPGDPAETKQSKAFWEKHAVTFNGQAIVASTITKECPF